MTQTKYGKKIRFARKLRKDMTAAERILWQELRNRKLSGIKFRRQAPMDKFVVDFLSFEKRLVIEVDGGIHQTQKEYDQSREIYLKRKGYRIMRFTNEEVVANLDEVLLKIHAFVT